MPFSSQLIVNSSIIHFLTAKYWAATFTELYRQDAFIKSSS